MCSSYASANPVFVSDSRASNDYGRFASASSLNLWNMDQKGNASNETFQMNVPQDQKVTSPVGTDGVMFVPSKVNWK